MIVGNVPLLSPMSLALTMLRSCRWISPGSRGSKEKVMKLSLSLSVCAMVLLTLAIPSSAGLITYNASLSGPNAGNASPGSGLAVVTYDDVARTLRVQVTFSDLEGTVTAAHIHGPTTTAGTGTAGVITTTPSFAGFPLGVTSGTYDNTLDLTQASSWNASFITNNGGTTATAETALAASMAAGTAYFNVHTTMFPGGEIRGFLTPTPEPATLALLASGLWFVRRKAA
jgi:hypothetical protein